MFRWKTAVVTGQWHQSHQSALADALRAGQADMVNSDIVLHSFVQIEHNARVAAEPAGQFKRAA